jgi:hypothetical protein
MEDGNQHCAVSHPSALVLDASTVQTKLTDADLSPTEAKAITISEF